MGLRFQCFIPSFVEICTLVPGKKILKCFTIYGHENHIGQVTNMMLLNFHFIVPESLHFFSHMQKHVFLSLGSNLNSVLLGISEVVGVKESIEAICVLPIVNVDLVFVYTGVSRHRPHCRWVQVYL